MNDIPAELNVNKKIPVVLGSVQKTLLLPLWGRAIEAGKKEPLLIDRTAMEIISQLEYDFSTIAGNINEVVQVGWIARSLLIDNTIKRFLKKDPQATIVNIGCGFDTTFDRVDNGTVTWYDLDLPDVIELRRRFIPDNERRKTIASSFLDYNWFKQLKAEENILFVAAGVLCYFEEYEIKEFFKKITDSFPGSEMIFEAYSPISKRISNKIVLKDGGMDEQALIKWGLKRAKSISLWDSRIKILDEYLFYKNMKRGLSIRGKILTLISDSLRMLYLVHLKFAP